jgi:hypothetical protein
MKRPRVFTIYSLKLCVCVAMRHVLKTLGVAKKREHPRDYFLTSVTAFWLCMRANNIPNGRRKLTALELKYLNEALDVQTRLLFSLGAQTYLHTCISMSPLSGCHANTYPTPGSILRAEIRAIFPNYKHILLMSTTE